MLTADKKFTKWNQFTFSIQNYLFTNPDKLIEWPSDDFCPVQRNIPASCFESNCADVCTLTSIHIPGKPHKKPVHKGFEIETGNYKGQAFIVRSIKNVYNLDIQLVSLGPTWWIKTNSFNRKTYCQIVLRELLGSYNYIIPKLIFAWICNNNGYMLSEYCSGEYNPINIRLLSKDINKIKSELTKLFEILSQYQWYEPEIEQCLYLVEQDSGYSLRYIPSGTCEVKYKLKSEEDLLISPQDYQEGTELLRTKQLEQFIKILS